MEGDESNKYLEERFNDQIGWYNSRSTLFKGLNHLFRIPRARLGRKMGNYNVISHTCNSNRHLKLRTRWLTIEKGKKKENKLQ